jgi:hypothetical protein
MIDGEEVENDSWYKFYMLFEPKPSVMDPEVSRHDGYIVLQLFTRSIIDNAVVFKKKR